MMHFAAFWPRRTLAASAVPCYGCAGHTTREAACFPIPGTPNMSIIGLLCVCVHKSFYYMCVSTKLTLDYANNAPLYHFPFLTLQKPAGRPPAQHGKQ